MRGRQADRLEGTEQVSIVSNCEEELPKRLENHFGIYKSDIHEKQRASALALGDHVVVAMRGVTALDSGPNMDISDN